MPFRPSSILIAGFLFGLSGPRASAQEGCRSVELKYRFDSAGSLDALGRSVAFAGDVDGDGIPDMIAGAPLADPGGQADAGSALVYSGATGVQLHRFDGQAGDELGYSVAGAGDLDGDGFDDLLVGARRAKAPGIGRTGSALVFSGATGGLLLRVDGLAVGDRLGSSVAGAGDLDGDGVPDILAGAPRADPGALWRAGSAFVFSGATGASLFRFDGSFANEELGFSVSGGGDVNGDGTADLIVGGPFADAGGLTDSGSAYILSGATGLLLRRLDGTASDFEFFGDSVSGAGDVDADGVADWIVGAPGFNPQGLDEGAAFVYSGATGALLLFLDGPVEHARLGDAVAAGGDVDGDGTADVISGGPAKANHSEQAGIAFVFSGTSGKEILRLEGKTPFGVLGVALAGARDVDGDGRSDLLAGSPGAVPAGPGGPTGSVFLLTYNPALSSTGETLSILRGGTIEYAIDFPAADAGAGYRILLSAHGTGPTLLHGLSIPLTKDGFFRASLRGNTPPQASGFQGTLDAAGDAAARITVPPLSLPLKLAGRRFPLHLAVINSHFDQASLACSLRFVL